MFKTYSCKIFKLSIALAGVTAMSAQAADTNVDITAEILQAVQLTTNQDMDFGTLSLSGSAGTVVMAPGGGITATGVTHLGGQAAAEIELQAATGQALDISFGATTVNLSNGTDTLAIDSFTHDMPTTISSSPATFNVGGTLNVATGSESGGVYNSSTPLVVTVNYQ